MRSPGHFTELNVILRPVVGMASVAKNADSVEPNDQGVKPRVTSRKLGWWARTKLNAIRFELFVRSAIVEELAYGTAFLFIPVILGAGAITWFSSSVEIPVPSVGFLLLTGIFVILYQFQTRGLVWYLGLALFWFAAGMALAKLETARFQTVLLDSPVTTHVSGTLVDREKMAKGQWRYVLTEVSTDQPTLKRQPTVITLVARIHDRPARLGERVSGLARLTPPSGPALPELNNFGFDAYFSGIGAVGYFYGAPATEPETNETGTQGNRLSRFSNQLNIIRSAIGTRIQSILPGDTGAFATSMVTDERRAISKETTEALRLSGLAHIVAISGLNMALASGIYFVGFRTIFSLLPGLAYRFNTKKIAAIGALIGLIAYYLISGSAVSAERAFIMMAVILLAVVLDRPSISLRNVALSATFIEIMSPSAITGPSFQMSFAATLALVSGYHLFAKIPWPENPFSAFSLTRYLAPISRFVGGILLSSAIGGASTAIFSIEHFHRVAAYGLPANLIAMPAVSFIVMPFGLIAMLLMPFGLDEIPLRIMGFGLDITIAVAQYVSSFGGNIVTGRLPEWFFPTASAGFIITCLFRTRLRLLGVMVFCAAILVQGFIPARQLPDLVVYEDGTLAAKVSPGLLAVNIAKPPDFIFTQIEYGLGITETKGPIPVSALTLPKRKKGEPRPPLTFQQRDQTEQSMIDAVSKSNGQFACAAKQWCVVSVRNVANVALVQDPIFTGTACDAADVVIVSVPLRYLTCHSGALLITRDTLRKRGSLEVTFPETLDQIHSPEEFLDQIQITGALDGITRDWTKHRYYQWRSDRFDPPFGDDVNYSDE